MLRAARIDLPDLYPHVVVHGIEGRNVFEDIRDPEKCLELCFQRWL